ncbi:MAG TPA: extracellular solute-binding protein [Chloroflexota bacterium]|nr:extracellular solute-binding protein [Chloroflexota bacterium]
MTRMGFTRRRVIGNGAGGAALIALAACGQAGGSSGQSGQADQTAASGKIVWQARDPATYKAVADWAVGEFKKKYPNITVEADQTSTGNFDKTITTLVAGSGPDILYGWGRLMVQYAAKGVVMNHNDLVKGMPAADVQDFVKTQWDGMVVPTTSFRYGIPNYVNLFMLYYNKTLFQSRGQKEPDDTWDHNTYATALKAMTFEQGGKQVYGGFGNLSIADRQWHVRSFGGNFVDPKDLTKTGLGEGPAQQGMQWVYDRLYTDRSFAPIDGAKRTWTPNSQQDGFGQGVLATFEDGMDKLNPVAMRMAQGNEWNIMHMPKGPAGRNTLITTDAQAIWKNTKSKDAAWSFLQFLASKEFYGYQASSELLIPSRKSVFDTWMNAVKPKLQSSSPNFNFKVIQDALNQTYPTVDQVFLCQQEAERVLNDALGAVLTRGEKPTSYFRDVANQINQAAGSCGAKFT